VVRSHEKGQTKNIGEKDKSGFLTGSFTNRQKVGVSLKINSKENPRLNQLIGEKESSGKRIAGNPCARKGGTVVNETISPFLEKTRAGGPNGMGAGLALPRFPRGRRGKSKSSRDIEFTWRGIRLVWSGNFEWQIKEAKGVAENRRGGGSRLKGACKVKKGPSMHVGEKKEVPKKEGGITQLKKRGSD